MKTRMIRHAARGFTLLEMMVVLLIIGLLMSVAIMNFAGQGKEARKKTTMQSMATIHTTLTQYNLDNGTYPPTLDLLVPKYLAEMPRDAWKRAFVYFPNTATGATSSKPFTLYSKGESGEDNAEDSVDYWKEKDLATGNTQNP